MFFPNLYIGAQISLPKQWDFCEKVKGENPRVGTWSVSGKTLFRAATDCKQNYCQNNRGVRGALPLNEVEKLLRL